MATDAVDWQDNVNGKDLEDINEGHVVGRDVVIVFLDVAECLLVVPYQRVNLRVLSLFQLVQFGLSTEIVLCLEGTQLDLVLGLDLSRVALVLFRQRRHELGMRLFTTRCDMS